MSDISLSLLSPILCLGGAWVGALLIGGNPGRGGIPEPGPTGRPGLPLSFLNLLVILHQNSFSLSLAIHPIIPRTTMMPIINSHIHRLLFSPPAVCGLQHISPESHASL